MLICSDRSHAAAWCPDKKTGLDQKRFVYIFQGVFFLTYDCCKRVEADRSTLEFIDQCQQYPSIHFIKAGTVYRQQVQCFICHFPVYYIMTTDL